MVFQWYPTAAGRLVPVSICVIVREDSPTDGQGALPGRRSDRTAVSQR